MGRGALTALACAAIVGMFVLIALSLSKVNDLSARRHADIERERVDFILRSCRDTNARHDRALAKLAAIIGSIPDPARRARAEQGEANAVAIIEAIVPRQDCETLARGAVR